MAPQLSHTPPSPPTVAVVGHRRLNPEQIAVLASLPARFLTLDAGQDGPPSARIVVVVDDQGGLGELTHYQACGAAALFVGKRAEIAVACTEAGASPVVCLPETDTLFPHHLAPLLRSPTSRPEEVLLNTLPVAVAVISGDGAYSYRNPVHQQLNLDGLNPEGGSALSPLDLGEFTDPVSGRVYLWSHRPLEGGNGVMEVLEEITGRHTDQSEITRQRDQLARRARELAASNRELAQLDHTKAEFIALAAHEIRTPLTALGNALHLLHGGNTIDPKATNRHSRVASMAHRNLARLTTLADDLLEFTKLQTEQLDLVAAPVHMHRVIKQALERIHGEATDIHLIPPPNGSLPPLEGEAERLTQALHRMLENAVRRSDSGHTVGIETGLSDTPPAHHDIDLPVDPANWLTLRVYDDAPTLNVTQLNHLFNDFGHGQDALSAANNGGGLGLAICRQVIAAHGGACWAEAGPKGGTRLQICLPILSADELELVRLGKRLKRLQQQQQSPWLVVLMDGSSRYRQAQLSTACQEADWHSALWVVQARPLQAIGIVPGGKQQVSELVKRVDTQLRSSDGTDQPIQVGWAAPGADATLRNLIRQARAVARPLPEYQALIGADK